MSEGGTSEAEVQALVSQSLAADDTPAQAAAIAVQDAVTSLSVIQSLNVTRVIAVPVGDPLPSLQEGDIVIRYTLDGASYYTDFSTHTLGEHPADFTDRWNSSGASWAVVDDGSDRVLRMTSGGGRVLLSWDTIDADADRGDVELLTRWRSSTSGVIGGLAARGSGGSGTETGYRGGGTTPTNVAVTKYVGGVYTLLDGPERPSSTVGAWHYTRLRVNGDTVSSKIWQDGTTEPAAWQATTTDTSITAAGWVGLSVTQAGTVDFDWLAVGTAGRMAVPA